VKDVHHYKTQVNGLFLNMRAFSCCSAFQINLAEGTSVVGAAQTEKHKRQQSIDLRKAEMRRRDLQLGFCCRQPPGDEESMGSMA
jgi:hypothetical protein